MDGGGRHGVNSRTGKYYTRSRLPKCRKLPAYFLAVAYVLSTQLSNPAGKSRLRSKVIRPMVRYLVTMVWFTRPLSLLVPVLRCLGRLFSFCGCTVVA